MTTTVTLIQSTDYGAVWTVDVTEGPRTTRRWTVEYTYGEDEPWAVVVPIDGVFDASGSWWREYVLKAVRTTIMAPATEYFLLTFVDDDGQTHSCVAADIAPADGAVWYTDAYGVRHGYWCDGFVVSAISDAGGAR